MLTIVAGATLDYIDDRVYPGGPAYYMGMAVAHLDAFARIITTESYSSNLLKKLSGCLEVFEAGKGETIFKIEVLNGSRSLRVLKAVTMDLDEILRLTRSSESIVVSTTLSELNVKDLSELAKDRIVVIDVQGFVRVVEDGGKVRLVPKKVFELSKSLYSSRRLILRGEREEFPEECWSDPLWCSEQLIADIVITDGEKPLKVVQRGGVRFYELKPLPGFHGRPVGLGDVFTAVLSYYLLNERRTLLEAAALASIASALKLREKYPWFTGSELDILRDRVLTRVTSK